MEGTAFKQPLMARLLVLPLLLAASARSCDIYFPDLDPLAFPAAPLLTGVFMEEDIPNLDANQHQSRPLMFVYMGNQFKLFNLDTEDFSVRSREGTGSDVLDVEEWEYVDPVSGDWLPAPGPLRAACAPSDMHQCDSQHFRWTSTSGEDNFRSANDEFRPVRHSHHRPAYRSGHQHLRYKDSYWRVSGGDVRLRARSSALTPAGLGDAVWEESTRGEWRAVERRLTCVTPPSDNCTKCRNKANCFLASKACLCPRGFAGAFCARAQERCPPLPAEVHLPLGSPAVEGDLAFSVCEDGSVKVRSCHGGRWTSVRCPGDPTTPMTPTTPEDPEEPKKPKKPSFRTLIPDRSRPDRSQDDSMKQNESLAGDKVHPENQESGEKGDKPPTGENKGGSDTKHVLMVAMMAVVVTAAAAGLLFALIWWCRRRTTPQGRQQVEQEEAFEL